MAEAIYATRACALKSPIPSDTPSWNVQADLCGFPEPAPVALAVSAHRPIADPDVARIGTGGARPQVDVGTLVERHRPCPKVSLSVLDGRGKLRVEIDPLAEPMTMHSRRSRA